MVVVVVEMVPLYLLLFSNLRGVHELQREAFARFSTGILSIPRDFISIHAFLRACME